MNIYNTPLKDLFSNEEVNQVGKILGEYGITIKNPDGSWKTLFEVLDELYNYCQQEQQKEIIERMTKIDDVI